MVERAYLDFDLLIERANAAYRAKLLRSPVGEATLDFSFVFQPGEYGELHGVNQGSRLSSGLRWRFADAPSTQKFGTRLFETVFAGEIGSNFLRSLDKAGEQQKNLRLLLRFADTPDLSQLPWEYLYNPSSRHFLALTKETPIVRYPEIAEPVARLPVQPPLSILVMMASPFDFPALDCEREWEKLKEALQDLRQNGRVEIQRLEHATRMALQRKIQLQEYHILHFIGHGDLQSQKSEGALIFEDKHKRGHAISGRDLGMLLHDHHTLRLAILNACQGASAASADPFSSVAQSLVRQRVPAVIAMQAPISDEAAVVFSHEFYTAIANGYAVEAAMAEARLGMYNQGHDVEWGTPVLFMRASDGRIFNIVDDQKEKFSHIAGEKSSTFWRQIRSLDRLMAAIVTGFVLLLLYWCIPVLIRFIQERFVSNELPRRKHILVLPFTNVGNDSNQQAFCDGLMDILTSTITQFELFAESLWVVPTIEVRDKDIRVPKEAWKIFGADLVVEGSVQQVDGQIHLTVNLIKVTLGTSRVLKSMSIRKRWSEVTDLQDSASVKLASMLRLQLQTDAHRVINAGGTKVHAAFIAYVQGNGFLQRYEESQGLENPKDIEAALDLFQRAIQQDSLYARAYEGLALAQANKYSISGESKWLEAAMHNGEKAHNLDSAQVSILITLGRIYATAQRPVLAVEKYRQALNVNPGNAEAFTYLGRAYAEAEEYQQAEEAFKRAVEIKPDYWIGHNELGNFYFELGRYREGLERFQYVTKLTPENAWGYNNLGASYLRIDSTGAAAKAFKWAIAKGPIPEAHTNLGYLHYRQSRYLEAAQQFEDAIRLDSSNYYMWGNLAEAYAQIPLQSELAKMALQRAVALAEIQKNLHPTNLDILVDLASYMADLGVKDRARTLVNQVVEKRLQDPHLMFMAGYVYEKLGERALAMTWILKALENGYPVSELKVYPSLMHLRQDPRFLRLLRESDIISF